MIDRRHLITPLEEGPMARNAHPEITERRILAAAKKLFFTNGYDRTSIQDIVNELGDLSKGAIYHHFPSKEAIFESISNADAVRSKSAITALETRTDLNGLSKIREFFHANVTDSDHVQLVKQGLHFLDDAKEFAANITFWSTALPTYWRPLIDEGIEDGSVPTQYPKEASELLALLTNYWLPTHFFPATRTELEHRIRCLATMLDAIDVHVFDNVLIEEMLTSGIFEEDTNSLPASHSSQQPTRMPSEETGHTRITPTASAMPA